MAHRHGKTAPVPARLSRPKRLLFSLVLAALVVGLIELTSYVGYRFVARERFSWSTAQADRAAILDELAPGGELGRDTSREVPHPYLGYVPNPEQAKTLSKYGFPTDTALLARGSPDRVVVAVLGGSVAQAFAKEGLPRVLERLERSSRFNGRKLVVANLAIGGYKQPQQLMTLNYLLTLGFDFDIVLNIDGFNEVALHEPENGKKHVFPVYPRSWYLRVAAVPDRTLRARTGRVAYLEERIAGSARTFSKVPWCWSATCNLFWRARHEWLRREHVVAMIALAQYEPPESPYLVTGPRVEFGDDEELYEHLVGIWKRGSLQLDRLCRANGIHYYHFLQPNQYVPASKPLTAEERTRAFRADHPYRVGVDKGYPLLVRDGAELIERGVRFVDLTHLFAGEERTVYADDCCHLNALGNRLVADRVARELLADGT